MSITVFHNANILSFHDGFQPGADTLVVEGNRIRAVGRFDALQSFAQDGANLIDLSGNTLMPGMNDSHIHVWKVGNLKTFMLDVRAARSLEEMLSMISDYHRAFPDVAWIVARGFNEAGWANGRMPERTDLDKVVKDKPVYVIRTCAHIAVANTCAIDRCGITSDTIVPEGGVMYKGSDGRPNGIFSETALGLVANQIPPYTIAELQTMVKAAREELYSFGVTAVTDPAVDPVLLEAYYDLHRRNELGIRLNAIPILLPDGGEQPYPVPDYFDSGFFKVNTVKFFSDGGLSGKTAALKGHYKDSNEQGVLRLKREQYIQLCTAAMEKGLGLATHAIGDAAIDFVVDIYRQLHQSFPQLIKRIEHLGLPEQRHLDLMAANNIATSMQTVFLSELGKNFIRYLDQHYLDHCYPVRSVLDSGVLVALSSDAPVVKDFNPMKGVEAAVTRKNNEGDSIAPQESISIAEALKAYTADAARISVAPDFGSLQEGHLADLVVLDRDPLQQQPEQITGVKVLETWVDGRKVWSS